MATRKGFLFCPKGSSSLLLSRWLLSTGFVFKPRPGSSTLRFYFFTEVHAKCTRMLYENCCWFWPLKPWSAIRRTQVGSAYIGWQSHLLSCHPSRVLQYASFPSTSRLLRSFSRPGTLSFELLGRMSPSPATGRTTETIQSSKVWIECVLSLLATAWRETLLTKQQ